MAEASLDIDDLASSPDGGAAPKDSPTAAGAIMFAGRYMVQPGAPIPEFSTPSAKAYVATDREGTSGDLYALVTDSAVPVRSDAMIGSRVLDGEAVIRPVKWGHLDWPLTGRMESVLIIPRPNGNPLMSLNGPAIRPMAPRDIITDVLQPILSLMSAMSDSRLVHRNIRPDNMFRSNNEGPIISGEFVSAPPGFRQPSCFEPLDRAVCPPLSRGTGDVSDDLYALGVTVLFLALGQNPVADIDDATLLTRRMEHGSFSAILGENRLPTELGTAIRALMRDNPHERWTLDDFENWVKDSIVNPTQPKPFVHVDRPFEFAGSRYYTAPDLAMGLAKHWDEAVAVAKSDAIERWAERSMKDREFAQDIADCRLSGSGGPRMITDDLLLARVLIVLNPIAPLRFRKVVTMPDGLGTLTVSAANDAELTRDLKEMLSSQLLAFWTKFQPKSRSWTMGADTDATKILNYLNHSGLGYHIERAMYEMNNGLACQSSRLHGIGTTQPRDVLMALDATTSAKESLVDKHIAAFLGARYSGSIDTQLTELGTASGATDVQLAQLKLLAAVQNKHGPNELPNLFNHFLNTLDQILERYHNVNTRKKLKRAAERASEGANLGDLAKIVDNQRVLRSDQKGFDYARRMHRMHENDIRLAEDSFDTVPARARTAGQRAAAYISAVIGTAILAFFVFSRLT